MSREAFNNNQQAFNQPLGSERSYTEISDMIRSENDPDKRSVLLVCQSLTAELMSLGRLIEGMKREHDSRIDDQQRKLEGQRVKLEEHEEIVAKAKATLQICAWIAGVTLSIVGAVGTYGYSLIADLRDTLNSHNVSLPALEKEVTSLRDTVGKLNLSK